MIEIIDKSINTILNQSKKEDNFKKNTPEEEDLDSESNSKMMEVNIQIKKDKHELSVYYFKKTYWFICGYIVIIVVMVAFIELGWLKCDRYVITTFLGTTSINIIGLAYIAMRWLFPNS